MESVGDLAAVAAEKLQAEHVAGIASGEIKLQEDVDIMHMESRGQRDSTGRGSKLRTKGSIMDRVRFGWRPEDSVIMEQIKAGADAAFIDLYDNAFFLIDALYEKARIPKKRNGQLLRDSQKRVIWEVDDNGMIVQDWSQLTGQDFETVLFQLQELKLHIAPKLNGLLMEAIFAKHLYDDVHSDAYSAVVEGTIGDREARANREARTDKYAAYFRFYLWSQGDVFMRELNSLQRLLEKTRDWGVRSQRS